MKHPTKWSLWLLFTISLIELSFTDVSAKETGTEILKAFLKSFQPIVPHLDKALSAWDGYDVLIKSVKKEPELDDNRQFAVLATKVDAVARDMNYYHANLTDELREMNKDIKLDDKMTEFIKAVSAIERISKRLMEDLTFVRTVKYKNVEGTIKKILDKVPDQLIEVIDTLTETRINNYDVFDLLLDPDLRNNVVCHYKSSIQHRMYNIFKIAHEKDEGTWKSLAVHFNHTKQLVDLFEDRMSSAPRDLHACDPENAEEGTTYERFGRAFQKYLFNIKNIEKPEWTDSNVCHASCEDVPTQMYYWKSWRRYPGGTEVENYPTVTIDESRVPKEPEGYDGLQHWKLIENFTTDYEWGYQHMHEDVLLNRCAGQIRNCRTIKEDKLRVCKAQPGMVERYSYIGKMHDKETTERYGSESLCTDSVYLERPTLSAWTDGIKELGRGYNCNYCMCTCDYGQPQEKGLNDWADIQKSDTDRYINLLPVYADSGHVVTGVRLRKYKSDHTFYLEIEQAKLLPSGRVSRPHWNETSHEYQAMYIDQKQNEHYHKITFNKTVVYLDDVVAARDNQFVTGIRFKVHSVDQDERAYLGLQVQYTEFDLKTGKAINGDKKWFPESPLPFDKREPLKVGDQDVPNNYNGEHTRITGKGRYVVLENSGLNYDVGQNVLPFIDIQEVKTVPSLPLAGVSLYHRGVAKGGRSGGYLALKVTNINLRSYIPDAKELLEEREKILASSKLASSK